MNVFRRLVLSLAFGVLFSGAADAFTSGDIAVYSDTTGGNIEDSGVSILAVGGALANPLPLTNVTSSLGACSHEYQGCYVNFYMNPAWYGDNTTFISDDMSMYTAVEFLNITTSDTVGVAFTVNGHTHNETTLVSAGDTSATIDLRVGTAIATDASLLADLATIHGVKGQAMGNPFQSVGQGRSAAVGVPQQISGNFLLFDQPWVTGTQATGLSGVTVTPINGGGGTVVAITGPGPGVTALSGTTNTSTSVTGLSSNAGLYVGEPAYGSGVPAGDTIATINANGTALTLTAATSSSVTTTLSFGPGIAADGNYQVDFARVLPYGYTPTIGALGPFLAFDVGSGANAGAYTDSQIGFLETVYESEGPTNTPGWSLCSGAAAVVWCEGEGLYAYGQNDPGAHAIQWGSYILGAGGGYTSPGQGLYQWYADGSGNMHFEDITHTSDIMVYNLSGTYLSFPVPLYATALATDATKTDRTLCEDTTTHEMYSGTGTGGICLGTSAARFKAAIESMSRGVFDRVSHLWRFMHIRPTYCVYKPGYGDNIGGAKPRWQECIIADELLPLFPELVNLDATGRPNGTDYLGLAAVEAVNDVQTLGYIVLGLVAGFVGLLGAFVLLWRRQGRVSCVG